MVAIRKYNTVVLSIMVLHVLDDVKVVMGEGMPIYKSALEKGRLIIMFKVRESVSYTNFFFFFF